MGIGKGKYDKASSIALLLGKQKELLNAGIARYPRRSDFTEEEVVAVKAFLGPWPRALEEAGLKPPRNDGRLQRNREKRIRAGRRRNEALRTSKRGKKDPGQNDPDR